MEAVQGSSSISGFGVLPHMGFKRHDVTQLTNGLRRPFICLLLFESINLSSLPYSCSPVCHVPRNHRHGPDPMQEMLFPNFIIR